jgi:hypothetical protein
VVSIQSSYTFASKCRCSSLSINLMSCSFLICCFYFSTIFHVEMSFLVFFSYTPFVMSHVEFSFLVSLPFV